MTWGEHCDACGWCDRPGACVMSVACPRCYAGPKQSCRVPNTARLEGLHAERWETAGIDFRTWGDVLVIDELPVSEKSDKDFLAPLIPADEWEELRRIEEFLTEAPVGVDARVIDSIIELQRLEEATT